MQLMVVKYIIIEHVKLTSILPSPLTYKILIPLLPNQTPPPKQSPPTLPPPRPNPPKINSTPPPFPLLRSRREYARSGEGGTVGVFYAVYFETSVVEAAD